MMSEQTIAIQVPDPLYQRLRRLSEISRRPLESLVLQTLDANVPMLPENLPAGVRDDLRTLESLDDEQLWEIARSELDPAAQAEYAELRAKNSQNELAGGDKAHMEVFYLEANRLMLRKAYAFALLKWRGHHLPSLSDLESRS